MKTIVAMYDDVSNARQSIHELVQMGIDRNRISLIAGDREDRYATELDQDDAGDHIGGGVATGAVVGGLGGLLLGLGALAIPGIGPVIAAGPIVSALVGAGVGAAVGGLVGALTEVGVPEEQAGYYAEGVRRGSTLVTVETPETRVDETVAILERYHPIDIDERASTWQEEGWTGTQTDTEAAARMHTNRERRGYGANVYQTPEEYLTTEIPDRTRTVA
jgi:hypothetical protein